MPGGTSKSAWKNLEYFVRDLIGGKSVYAQSAKFYLRTDKMAMGDVSNSHLLCECKLRDCATKKFRATHKRTPYSRFTIDLSWWTQIVQECHHTNDEERVGLPPHTSAPYKVPVLVCRAKYGGAAHTLFVMNVADYAHMGNKLGVSTILPVDDNPVEAKSVSVVFGETELPVGFRIPGLPAAMVMTLEQFEKVREAWRT